MRPNPKKAMEMANESNSPQEKLNEPSGRKVGVTSHKVSGGRRL